MKPSGRFFRSAAAAILSGLFLLTASPPVQAASPVVVALSTNPVDCGPYHTATTNLAGLLGGSTSGTIVICPGTYTPTLLLSVNGANKLTIKQAVPGPESRPIIRPGPGVLFGLMVSNSQNLTLDGLIIDASTNPNNNFRGIQLNSTSGAIRNVTIIGPNKTGTLGLEALATGVTKALPITVSNTHILGYSTTGAAFGGGVKVTMSGCVLDGSDGGRVAGVPYGLVISSISGDPVPATGSVTNVTLINNLVGFASAGGSKLRFTNNRIIASSNGIQLTNTGLTQSMDGITISGNTITGIAQAGYGIQITNNNLPAQTTRKLSISKNTFVANQYTTGGVNPTGIEFVVNDGASPGVSGSISGNVFVGFPPAAWLSAIPNNVKISKNEHTP